MASDPAHWLAEAVPTRELDRVKADMAAAGMRVNDARAVLKAARTITDVSSTLAIAGCHDAARPDLDGLLEVDPPHPPAV